MARGVTSLVRPEPRRSRARARLQYLGICLGTQVFDMGYNPNTHRRWSRQSTREVAALASTRVDLGSGICRLTRRRH